jgi:hypothetical protein
MGRARTQLRFARAAVVALCVIGSGAAYGGINASLPASAALRSASMTGQQPAPNPTAGVQPGYDTDELLARSLHDLSRPGQRTAALPLPPPARDPAMRALPPAPSSLSLVLSALVTLGAYQGGRSFKRLHLGSAPDWYHTGGPTQIGHVTLFDLEFGALPLCVFDQPVALPAFAYRVPRELASRLRGQHLLIIESPRGPPRTM